MTEVWIPSLWRDLTQGERHLTIPASSLAEVVAELERRYPGMAERMTEDGRMRRGIAVVVNGEVNHEGLRRKLGEKSEVHFLPSLSGG